MTIYRVQGPDGRGPWRPGWSHTWIDDAAPVGRLSETVLDLLGGGAVGVAELLSLPGDRHYGCGCVSMAGLREWFTTAERRRLGRLGFHPVRVRVDGVIAASAWQVLTWRRRPFREGAVRVGWAA